MAGGGCSCLLRLSLFFLFVQFFDGLYLLLQLHPPVLEPDFDLPLSQAQGMSHLDASSPRQIMICVEFLLQLQRLVSSVRLPATSPQTIRTCNERKGQRKLISARRHFYSRPPLFTRSHGRHIEWLKFQNVCKSVLFCIVFLWMLCVIMLPRLILLLASLRYRYVAPPVTFQSAQHTHNCVQKLLTQRRTRVDHNNS